MSDRDRDTECIRAVLNLVRGEAVSAGAIIKKLKSDGWTRDEVIEAIVAINPDVVGGRIDGCDR